MHGAQMYHAAATWRPCRPKDPACKFSPAFMAGCEFANMAEACANGMLAGRRGPRDGRALDIARRRGLMLIEPSCAAGMNPVFHCVPLHSSPAGAELATKAQASALR